MQHGDGRAVEPARSSGKGDITRRRRDETQRQRVARRCTVDGPIMVLKLLVALGLIGTGVYIHRLKEVHVEGTLPESSYETSIAKQKRLAYLLTLIGGVYVAGAALIGCMGRLARRRSLYCFYYCTTILGSTLLLLVAAWPLSMVNSPGGYCMAAEDHCRHVASLDECPVTMRLLAKASSMFSSETDWGPSGATELLQMEKRALQQKQEAHCCYQDDFVVYCSTLLGAFWLSTILASALAALNILQSSISCCVFWGLFDTADWTSQPMPGHTKQETAAAVFTPSTAPATGPFEFVEDSLGSNQPRGQVHREAAGASQHLSCNSGAEQGPGVHCTDSSKDNNFMSVV